jgi:hypothetical protein
VRKILYVIECDRHPRSGLRSSSDKLAEPAELSVLGVVLIDELEITIVKYLEETGPTKLDQGAVSAPITAD